MSKIACRLLAFSVVLCWTDIGDFTYCVFSIQRCCFSLCYSLWFWRQKHLAPLKLERCMLTFGQCATLGNGQISLLCIGWSGQSGWLSFDPNFTIYRHSSKMDFVWRAPYWCEDFYNYHFSFVTDFAGVWIHTSCLENQLSRGQFWRRLWWGDTNTFTNDR